MIPTYPSHIPLSHLFDFRSHIITPKSFFIFYVYIMPFLPIFLHTQFIALSLRNEKQYKILNISQICTYTFVVFLFRCFFSKLKLELSRRTRYFQTGRHLVRSFFCDKILNGSHNLVFLFSFLYIICEKVYSVFSQTSQVRTTYEGSSRVDTSAHGYNLARDYRRPKPTVSITKKKVSAEASLINED